MSGIDVPAERLRALRQEAVDVLAESMKRNGLIHPVTLRKRAGRGYWVVAGAHRLAAAEKLGWREIACVILDKYSEDEATLIEIDENLTRSELSPAERARHIKRRKAIYEKAHPETKNGATGKGRGKQLSQNEEAKERFTADTARKTGKSEAAVQRDATRAKRVEVLSEIINTSLDKGAELDALAKLPGAEQRDLAARAKAGEKVSARKPPKMDKLVEQALRLVAQMTAAERKIFLSKLEADTKARHRAVAAQAAKDRPRRDQAGGQLPRRVDEQHRRILRAHQAVARGKPDRRRVPWLCGAGARNGVNAIAGNGSGYR
nr:ParB N-terminal domain-containing protein [Bradyrhizobium sp. 87]